MFKYIKNFLSTNIFFLILLTTVVFALYGKSISFNLTNFDDAALITDNINFISDFRNIPKLFTKSAFYNNTTLYYRPILSLSFAMEAFFIRDNLKIYHITNIILFVLSLYLFYLFCMELKLNSVITKFVLLVIAVHPMFTSVVVWIPGRNDSLLTLFFISSFVFFIRYLNTQKIKYAFLFGLFFVLSLFTKENFILLISLYFIYLLFSEYRTSKKQIFFLFLCLLPFVLIFFILRKNSVVTFGYEHYISNIGAVIFNFIKYTFIYLYNFFIPEYIPTMLFNTDLSLKVIVYNTFFILVFGFLLYKRIISKKIFAFSILLILLSLFPAFVQEEFVYLNHRFFICSIGFIITIVLILDYLVVKIEKIKFLLILFFIIFFVGFFYISYRQTDKYKDQENFWINAYIDSPKYYATCQHLCRIYLDRGMIEEAKYYAKKTMELKPSYATFIEYAKFLMIIGDTEQAKEALLKIEEDVKKHKDLVYIPLSEIYYKEKDYEKALNYALMAYNMKRYDISYCKQLIKIYDAMEKYDEEIKIYEELLNYDKRNKEYEDKIMELKNKINSREQNNG